MKQHYTKIFLFVIPLNILITLYHMHNKNKPSITPHHTQTNRSLCESDTESSIYDNDEDMESVKEIFERQASQRLREYDERLQEKRQKRKQQRDKNIQKIIQKDKREKSLAEKIEKGCLMCGCGLGSVAGSVGLFGGIIINIWKPAAITAAIEAALNAAAPKIAATANAAGEVIGKALVIAELQKMGISTLDKKELGSFFTTISYKNVASIYDAVSNQYLETCTDYSLGRPNFRSVFANRDIHFCNSVLNQTSSASPGQGSGVSFTDGIRTAVQNMVSDAEGPAAKAAKIATDHETALIEAREIGLINTIFMSKQTAIIASIVAIIIIVLIMIIIYLVLRYRRKKKMKKKAQYTKLLNQ
ncbi:rifin PIR protein, putative [Plasmodium reichenowi]|uniref:Rifin PIR protein, putative n=1 Tax=Plasmodium reichenowi TaxID=5854 RepID=A0A2P9DCC4_PLARE|nr:rifin PIR protein, putative [Plasmodium reichenowi]